MTEPRRPETGAFYTLLLPGIVAHAMITGGGYSTGREIVQYAARFGPRGWLAVAVVCVGFAVLAALAFEVARLARAYDYKSWARQLIGPLWPAFDLLQLVMMLLVLAVMAAAMGSVLRTTLGVPYGFGLLATFVTVAFLGWKGTRWIERFKTIGTFGLWIVYLGFTLLALTAATAPATPVAAAPTAAGGAGATVAHATTLAVLVSAVQYVGYNLSSFPPVLFCLHRQTKRTQTIASGLLAGVAMTFPFALTFAALMHFWPDPEIFGAEVPWLPLLERASAGRGGPGPWTALFGLVAGWTLLDTAVGNAHALVDRVEQNLDDLPRRLRPRSGGFTPAQRALFSTAVLGAATLLARIGIIDLVARGYGMLAWGFIALLALPLLTVGVYRIWRGSEGSEAPPTAGSHAP
jgi:uncharacterized membrane protein YkvI